MRWIPDEDWTTPERGAFLVALSSSDPVDADGKISIPNHIAHNAALTGSVTNGADKNKPLKKITKVKFKSSDSEKTVSDAAVIFSPKGGIRSTADVYLVIAEAVSDGSKLLYPGGEINNFRVLKINRLTGKVEYHR